MNIGECDFYTRIDRHYTVWLHDFYLAARRLGCPIALRNILQEKFRGIIWMSYYLCIRYIVIVDIYLCTFCKHKGACSYLQAAGRVDAFKSVHTFAGLLNKSFFPAMGAAN